ncbi:SixA phosphatase family protein [Rufibacter latericius]|uniref:Histidine phosphatase family protein n=1 Tax=Rufibacter latericius TaxID=2487040 RepID=A0A3M9MJH6_9BACT|nr:histidine phosphatase family protein [Rufibacter latericius]RNI25013.1 histidine phosphatase family protein [Rufibacter latericius]
MKNLLLMRHATAADKAIGQTDFDREITLFGQRQAGEAGLWLKEQALLPELVLCSSAVRTRMTLENLLEEMNSKIPIQFEREIYYGSEQDMITLVHGVEDKVDTLLVLGHNPTISFLASALTHEEVSFSPATVAHLHFNGYSWENLRAGTCKLHSIYRE